jgi:hypothetical protein
MSADYWPNLDDDKWPSLPCKFARLTAQHSQQGKARRPKPTHRCRLRDAVIRMSSPQTTFRFALSTSRLTPPDRTRAVKTGPTPKRKTYDEWLVQEKEGDTKFLAYIETDHGKAFVAKFCDQSPGL